MNLDNFFDSDVESVTSARIARRNTIITDKRDLRIRRLRENVYNFLEKSINASNAGYHFSVFALILTTIVLGATTKDDQKSFHLHTGLEIFLAIFFVVELGVRLWSVTADAKYQKKYGRLQYLFTTVTLVDLVVVSATVLLISLKVVGYSSTIECLRFIQILRLLHVDRTMATWKLFRRMIVMSKWQLLAAYYITMILCVLMAFVIYMTEAYEQSYVEKDSHMVSSGLNVTANPTFPTLAHSLWFSIVTVLTIGYGDIVPKGASTKLVVCILGFLAVGTYMAASTLISVGLALMMEEDNKTEQQTKLRNVAASTIQCWYRYHKATSWQPEIKHTYFKHICYKLYITEERINKNRLLEQKLKEKLEKKRRKKSAAPTTAATQEMFRMSLKRVIKPIIPNTEEAPPTVERRRVMFREERPRTFETEISSTPEMSDVENMIDMKNILEEDLADVNLKDVDISLIIKYRPLLRVFNFLLFRTLIQKFKNLRKSDQILAIEAEIAENENMKNIKMKQLEARIISLCGKPATSPFDDSGEKLDAFTRVELSEKKLAELKIVADEVNQLATEIAEMLRGDEHNDQLKTQLHTLKRPKKISRHVTIKEAPNESESDEPDS